jgi:hypothetical protein
MIIVVKNAVYEIKIIIINMCKSKIFIENYFFILIK